MKPPRSVGSLTFDVTMCWRIALLMAIAVACTMRAEWRTVEAANLAELTVGAALVFRAKLVDLGGGSARFEPDRVYKGSGTKLVEVRLPTLAGCVPTTPMLLLSHSH